MMAYQVRVNSRGGLGDADTYFDGSVGSPTVGVYDRGALLLRLATVNTVRMDTFRKFAGYYVALAGTGSCVVWDTTTGAVVAQYDIGRGGRAAYVATVFDGSGQLTPAYVGYAGDTYFALSTGFTGVVPYADFDDMSCAAALRELAIVSGSHMWVDEYNSGNLIARKSARIMGRDPVEIDDPVESTEMPVWEWLRRSVEVTAKDEAGNDIAVVAGDPADSAYRLSVEVKMPITAGLAGALAGAYLAYLGADPPPRQLDELIVEPAERPLRMFDLATRDGVVYVVLRVETNCQDREQSVQLVERVF
jgi:hypothetical protein